MDMWDPFIASVEAHLKDAAKKIVFDKFHVAQHLGEAVDRVRRFHRDIVERNSSVRQERAGQSDSSRRRTVAMRCGDPASSPRVL
jgi:transposase